MSLKIAMCVCMYSGFLPQSKNTHVGLTGDSKLPLRMCEWTTVCCVSLSPVMVIPFSQGLLLLLPQMVVIILELISVYTIH